MAAPSPPWTHLAALTVLIRGGPDLSTYSGLIQRTQALAAMPWARDFDHVIFHEGNVGTIEQAYIRHQVGSWLGEELAFVNVAHSFTSRSPRARLRTALSERHGCNPTNLSASFAPGYHAMCAFWSVDVALLLPQHRYMLRIDSDCVLSPPGQADPLVAALRVSTSAPPTSVTSSSLDGHGRADAPVVVPFASAYYGRHFESPETTSGLDAFFERLQYSEMGRREGWKWERTLPQWQKGLPPLLPYTNVMLLDLHWARSEAVRYILQHVDESDCILTNRWGDIPLWGATLRLTNTTGAILNLTYQHGKCHITHHIRALTIPHPHPHR